VKLRHPSLSELQVLTFLSGLVGFFASVQLFRHFTWMFVLPLYKVVSSYWVFLTPLAAFVSYVIAVVNSLLKNARPAEAVREPLRWLRNIFFQSRGWMLAFVGLSTIACALAAITLKRPPPRWTDLLDQFAHGVNDDFALFKAVVNDRVVPVDSAAADEFTAVAETFQYSGRLLRGGNQTSDISAIANHLRASSLNRRVTPLHHLASGELATLMGDYDRARDKFLELLGSSSPLVTPLLMEWARFRFTRILVVNGDLAGAVAEVKQWGDTGAKFVNLSNLLTKIGDHGGALDAANCGLEFVRTHRTEQTESADLFALLTNRCFAGAVLARPEVLGDCDRARQLKPGDPNTWINQSLALLANARWTEAKNLLIDGPVTDKCVQVLRSWSIELDGGYIDAASVRTALGMSADVPPESVLSSICHGLDSLCGEGTSAVTIVRDHYCLAGHPNPIRSRASNAQ